MILLASQTGNLVNKYSLSKILGIDITTIEKYLYVLQKCFHKIIFWKLYQPLNCKNYAISYQYLRNLCSYKRRAF